jgi:hypothetical protein
MKKETIVIRTNDSAVGSCARKLNVDSVGSMWKCVEDSDKNKAYYAPNVGARKNSYRLASEKEIQAFNKGCRHIDNLDRYLITNNYPIY